VGSAMSSDLLMTNPGAIRAPLDIIDESCDMAPDAPVFALFSGGHDSLVSTHIASRHPRFSGVVHVNTGIGIEETRDFVRRQCQNFGWPLYEYKAAELPTPQVYEDVVLVHGFPGPAQHHRMYARLKERCLRHMKAIHAPRQPIILVTGIRKQESQKRMGYAREIDKRGQWLWTAPCVDWSEEDCRACMRADKLPRNPVKDKMCISGECLCGAFARSGERAELRHYYPEEYARIRRLEVAVVGTPCDRWGSGGPTTTTLRERAGQMRFMPLCVGCEASQP